MQGRKSKGGGGNQKRITNMHPCFSRNISNHLFTFPFVRFKDSLFSSEDFNGDETEKAEKEEGQNEKRMKKNEEKAKKSNEKKKKKENEGKD